MVVKIRLTRFLNALLINLICFGNLIKLVEIRSTKAISFGNAFSNIQFIANLQHPSNCLVKSMIFMNSGWFV